MKHLRTYILFLPLLILQTSRASVSDSADTRHQMAYQFLYDSLSNYVDLKWLKPEAEAMDDSLFLPIDSLKYFNFKTIEDSTGKRQRIAVQKKSYPAWLPNIVYTAVDQQTAAEFIAYKRSHENKVWDVSSFDRTIPDDLDSIHCKHQNCKAWISEPVFNHDCTLMVIETGEVSGPLSAYGFTAIFIFKDGAWQLHKYLMQWVS